MNQSENNKDLITSEDVKKSLSGDEQAIIEQLERAKQVALEQLEAKKKGIQTTDPNVAKKTQQQLEEELAKRERELNAAKVNAGLIQNQKPQQYQSDLNKRVEAVNMDIKARANPIDTTRNLNISNVEVQPGTIETKQHTQQQNIQTTATPIQTAIPNIKKTTKKELKEQKDQAKKLAKEERKAKSNFKYIMTIILFIGLFALVYFLPDISNYISAYQAAKANQENELITTGNLTCTLKTYNKKYDLEYTNVFAFTDSKLTKLTYTAKTKGDASKDQEELTDMNDKCKLLKSQTKSLDGVEVKCSLSNGVNTNIQQLDYKNIDKDKVTTSYLEAGGTYPSYKYNDSIDKIEKEMNAAGYTCERTS